MSGTGFRQPGRPKTTQRTPARAQRRATSAGALPRAVVPSTVPSPVTTKSKPVGLKADEGGEPAVGARQRVVAPSDASAAPSPPAAPAPAVPRRHERLDPVEPPLELLDLTRAGALLRGEGASRLEERPRQRRRGDTLVGAGSSPTDLEQSRAAVRRWQCPPSTPLARVPPDREDHLAEPRLDATERVESTRVERNRSAASTNAAPSRQSHLAVRGRPNAS